jgi:OPA family sugar phosphate sensor protein UhpC-like MFS transporter
VGAAMMFALAIACLVFPWLSAFSRTGNMLAIGLVGALTFGPDSLMSGAATQEAAGAGNAATAGGFVNGVGSVGQLASPILVAAAVRFGGWNELFTVFVCVAAIGGIALAVRWSAEKGVPEVRYSNA